MRSIEKRQLVVIMALSVLLAMTAVMMKPVTGIAQPEIYKLGLGLQNSGSACCLSVRLWNTENSATELTATASRNLFLTVRGLGKFSNNEVVDGYAGAGLAMIFGAAPPVPRSPVRALQLIMGLEIAVPLAPPQFTINLEGVVEADIYQNFDSYIGGGLHFYF